MALRTSSRAKKGSTSSSSSGDTTSTSELNVTRDLLEGLDGTSIALDSSRERFKVDCRCAVGGLEGGCNVGEDEDNAVEGRIRAGASAAIGGYVLENKT